MVYTLKTFGSHYCGPKNCVGPNIFLPRKYFQLKIWWVWDFAVNTNISFTYYCFWPKLFFNSFFLRIFFWPKIFLPKYIWPNFLWKIFFWPRILWPNVDKKFFSLKTFFDQIFINQNDSMGFDIIDICLFDFISTIFLVFWL